MDTLPLKNKQYTINYSEVGEYLYANGIQVINSMHISDVYHQKGQIWKKNINVGGDVLSIQTNEVFRLAGDLNG